MITEKAEELAALIRASEEVKNYKAAKERLAGSETEALIASYRKLLLRAQAAMVAGEQDDECMEKLRSLGGLLQTDPEASEYLLAELKLSRLLGDVYKILADAAEMDTAVLDD